MTQHSRDAHPEYGRGHASVPAWHDARQNGMPWQAPARPRGMTPGRKAALYIGSGVLAVLLLCCVGSTVVGAMSDEEETAASPATAAASATGQASSAAPGTPTATAQFTPTTAPAVDTRTVTETGPIPYRTRTVKDSNLTEGTRKVRTSGVPGIRTLTYEVTYTDGVETARRLLRQTVTRSPVTQVVAVGTRAATPRCDRNYSGACVPVASDVDCAGGSGNGPAYVSGVVRVVGDDVYDLDRDGDGYGCD